MKLKREIAAKYVKALHRIKPRPQSITVRKAERTLPRGWDWGAYVVLDIILSNGESVSATITLCVADAEEASGNVQLDADYGGVITTARAQTPDGVIQRLMSDTADHLSRGLDSVSSDLVTMAQSSESEKGIKMDDNKTTTEYCTTCGDDLLPREEKWRKCNECLDQNVLFQLTLIMEN